MPLAKRIYNWSFFGVETINKSNELYKYRKNSRSSLRKLWYNPRSSCGSCQF